MANKTLTVVTSYTFIDEDGATVKTSTSSTVPYGNHVRGSVKVAVGAPTGSYDIPIDGITGGTFLEIVNGLEAKITPSINGAPQNPSIAPGGKIVYASGKISTDSISSAAFATTEIATVAGSVSFKFFGNAE